MTATHAPKAPTRLRGLLVVLLLAALACGFMDRRRQVASFADLMAAARFIQNRVDQTGVVSAAEVQEIFSQMNIDHDRWGHPWIYVMREEPFSFLLVSVGADGTLDVADVEEYFDWPFCDTAPDDSCNVYGLPDKDIVLRDGRSVQPSSPK